MSVVCRLLYLLTYFIRCSEIQPGFIQVRGKRGREGEEKKEKWKGWEEIGERKGGGKERWKGGREKGEVEGWEKG